MQLSPASRQARVRRVLAISAAAVAVMIAPTACDYGSVGAVQGGSSSGDGTGAGTGADAGQQPVVVPVANKTQDRNADWRYRHRGHGGGKTTQPAPPPTTDPAAPPTDVAVTTDPATPPTDPATVPPTDVTTAPPTAPPVVTGVGAPLPPGGKDNNNNGLQILGRDCTTSKLPLHDGFQASPACVNTEMGEIAAEDKLPSLLIVDAPKTVGVNQPFTIKVSTRNLVRDRFLGAKAGGYYLESSFLNADGLQRGHFHTACRILPSITEAPNSGVAPEFFLATEDGGGSTTPDTVTVNVGAEFNTQPGDLQCTSWAGDGSHRTPMMTRANETPAIDSVRISVTNDAAPPAGYVTAAGNDPAAAQADAAKQAGVKQDEATQKPDVDKNGTTDTGGSVPASGPPASSSAVQLGASTPASTTPASDAPAAPATN